MKRCVRGRQKSWCRECGGSLLCQHGKYKSRCRECGGSAICQHNRRKDKCKECEGSSICPHGNMVNINQYVKSAVDRNRNVKRAEELLCVNMADKNLLVKIVF